MKKINIKPILQAIIIFCLIIGIAFVLYILLKYALRKESFKLNFVTAIKEHFEDTSPLTANDNVPAEEEEAIMAKTPDSAFRFKNYYLEQKPTQSTQIRHEFANTLPEGVLVGDLNISASNKINLSRVDSTGAQFDEYTLKAYGQESNSKSLRLSMQDEPQQEKAFEVWGASCRAQSDCNQPGVKLHKVTDKPSYEITGYGGNMIHQLDQSGVARHGKLDINNGKHILHESGHQYTEKSVNAKDVNVRGRLFFSNTPGNQDPNTSNFWAAHESDKMYIEKVITGENATKLIINLGDDNNDPLEIHAKNRKVMDVSGEKVEIYVPLIVQTKEIK